jgi:nucleoside-diphosphate-sugar epimerase
MTVSRRIVITGARGFLGQEVCRHLSKDVELFSIQRTRDPAATTWAETIVWDQDCESLAGIIQDISPSAVIHLAAHYRATDKASDLSRMIDASLALTGSIMFGLRGSRTRVVLAGSRFQRLRDGNPINVYSAMKSYQRQLAMQMATDGVDVIHLEVGDVYGVGDPRPKIIPRMVKAAAESSPFTISSPDNLLFPVHVRDVAQAIVGAASFQLGTSGDYAVVGPDGPLSVVTVAKKVEALVNRRVFSVADSPCARPIDRWLDSITELPAVMDGWVPSTSVSQGILELLAQYEDNGQSHMQDLQDP